YIMMHMKGTPSTMASETNYTHLVKDIITSLSQKVEKIHSLGHQQVIIDPGFGFAKTVDQNYELLANLVELKKLACPLLVGVSRKSMIYKLLDILPQESLNATTVLNTFALQQGARILRVHDVREAKQAVTLFTKLNEYS
ncbi:MAG: dihydropteroate synthase, partial [Cyclobacteriaceae bacterium]